jgi:hypothetical protein
MQTANLHLHPTTSIITRYLITPNRKALYRTTAIAGEKER